MLPLPILSGAGQNPSSPSVTAGQPHRLTCLVNVHAKTALTEPALESRSSQLSGAGIRVGMAAALYREAAMGVRRSASRL